MSGGIAWVDVNHTLAGFDVRSRAVEKMPGALIHAIGHDKRLHEVLVSDDAPNLFHQSGADPVSLQLREHGHFVHEELALGPIETIDPIREDEACQTFSKLGSDEIVRRVSQKPARGSRCENRRLENGSHTRGRTFVSCLQPPNRHVHVSSPKEECRAAYRIALELRDSRLSDARQRPRGANSTSRNHSGTRPTH